MWEAQWAVNTITILEWWRSTSIPLIVVAVDAHIVSSKAMVSSLSAAEHALPVDLIIAVFLAICLPCANIFEQAALAK